MSVLMPEIDAYAIVILILQGMSYFTFLYCINIWLASCILKHITIDILDNVDTSTYESYYGKEGTLDNIYIAYRIASDNIKTLKEELLSRILIMLIIGEIIINSILFYFTI